MRTCAFVCVAVGIILAADVSTLRGGTGNEKKTADAKDAEKALLARLQDDGYIGGPQVGYEIWVEDVTAQRLVQPIFIRLNARGGNDLVATAKEAELKIDTQKAQLVIRLRQGVATTRDGSRAYFEDKVFTVPLPPPKERK
jgi:hypothetical protein